MRIPDGEAAEVSYARTLRIVAEVESLLQRSLTGADPQEVRAVARNIAQGYPYLGVSDDAPQYNASEER